MKARGENQPMRALCGVAVAAVLVSGCGSGGTGGGSPVFYVTQGYAVLNNAEMPIVATNKDAKPNDNFIEQLTMNAEAAINVLDSMGVGDKNRVAVGGHSYGAFMTAN